MSRSVGPAANAGAARRAGRQSAPPTDPAPSVEHVRSPVAKTVFFGSGAFGLPTLEALLDAPEVELDLVVAAPDRPVGRRAVPSPPPVAARARELGLRLFQPSRLRAPDSVAMLASVQPDLGVLADYGQLVPDAVLGLFPQRILNLHPSLLPRHRGAAPVPGAILAGDGETGVTLMVLSAELDAGPIVAVERLLIGADETAPELEVRAATAAAALLRRSLGPWLAGESPAVPQPATGMTMTRPLRREDGRLDPSRRARLLERQVRAFQPWPGSFVETPEGRLVVWRAALDPASAHDAGRLVADADGLALTTADGRLRLLEVQLAGGRRMPSAGLRRGRPGLLGATVW